MLLLFVPASSCWVGFAVLRSFSLIPHNAVHPSPRSSLAFARHQLLGLKRVLLPPTRQPRCFSSDMIPFQSLLVLAPFMLACTAAGSPLFARQGQRASLSFSQHRWTRSELTDSPPGLADSYPPANQRGPAPLPAWIATYNAAVAAGRIPALPISASTGGNPVYPAGTDMQAVCSWTASHCFGRDDVVNAPAGQYVELCGRHVEECANLCHPPLFAASVSASTTVPLPPLSNSTLFSRPNARSRLTL